jgi:hypothetical protein
MSHPRCGFCKIRKNMVIGTIASTAAAFYIEKESGDCYDNKGPTLKKRLLLLVDVSTVSHLIAQQMVEWLTVEIPQQMIERLTVDMSTYNYLTDQHWIRYCSPKSKSKHGTGSWQVSLLIVIKHVISSKIGFPI